MSEISKIQFGFKKAFGVEIIQWMKNKW